MVAVMEKPVPENHRLVPIGQFAQASGLSLKALRLYDAAGLLTPARVDPASGYRYYHPGQLRDAQMIRMLRQLDLSVERVGELMQHLAAGKDVTPELTDHLTATARAVDRQWAVFHQITQRIARSGGDMTHPVTVGRLSPGPALAQRHTVTIDQLGPVAQAGYAELYTIAGRGPLTFPTPAFIRYAGRLDEGDSTEIEVCLPFWKDGAQPEDLPEHVYIVDVPEAQFAHTTLTGSDAAWPAVLQGYDAVSDWIIRHGFELQSPAYEIFQRWCGRQGHPDNVLEVGWPIEVS
jgi:DNA-binding transcriptional MerR regulator